MFILMSIWRCICAAWRWLYETMAWVRIQSALALKNSSYATECCSCICSYNSEHNCKVKDDLIHKLIPMVIHLEKLKVCEHWLCLILYWLCTIGSVQVLPSRAVQYCHYLVTLRYPTAKMTHLLAVSLRQPTFHQEACRCVYFEVIVLCKLHRCASTAKITHLLAVSCKVTHLWSGSMSFCFVFIVKLLCCASYMDMQVLQRWHIFFQCLVRWLTFDQEACNVVLCLL